MSQAITFGTDGWRAVIADGFTFDNVRRVSDAIAVAARTLQPPDGIDRNALVVGFDRRFLSREFASLVAETLRTAGFRVVLSNAPTPSQTISFTAWRRKLLGGVVVTASHNPAKYNGLKFKAWYGGSALPEMYAAIAAALGQSAPRAGGSIEQSDLLDDYVAALRAQVSVATNVRILHDPIHGVSSGLPSRILGREIATIRGEINPSFGGVNPEPIAENLGASMAAMKGSGEGVGSGRVHNGDRSGVLSPTPQTPHPTPFDIAICNDGDADRLGILDEKGAFVSPQKIIALLALYLVREKKLSGEIVKTFSTSRLVEKVARALGAGFHETAIGFKYVADLMLTRDILIGGEESGGIGFGYFLPERDGILSGLLVAECVGHYGKPLSEIVGAMEDEFGALHYDRRDLNRPMDVCARLIDRVKAGDLDTAFGPGFTNREETDGVKMNFGDGSWILFRKSGTEPIIRIYCESPDANKVRDMLDTAVRELDRA
ncbi:MAG TPA: phosphoglucomutase/phosphomannomutase family protein [Thermoanaerobaculia bacterium]|jgi:phosphomannomutase|nr:phosphoglucomutase/phosphomannomutase family protein [Thermoanaerobaculia bacterium]